MKYEALSDKILLLGMDGMDPKFTERMLAKGLMPNVQRLLDNGAANEHLVMLGGHPTITPPMWTTLACGCYANVHGITGFYRKGSDIDALGYNLDSRLCEAEQLWNVTAEAGLKTLVWHWPGAAWPPSSESENLMVVDGSSPGSVGMSVNQVDSSFLVGASKSVAELTIASGAVTDAAAPCVVTDLELDDVTKPIVSLDNIADTYGESTNTIIMNEAMQTTEFTENAPDVVKSPIKEAKGWLDAPKGAKEFALMYNKGLITRPCLILCDDDGKYRRVALYKNKKAESPLAVMEVGKMVVGVVDEAQKASGQKFVANRNFRLLELDEDGDRLVMYVSAAMDMQNDAVWHPKTLFKEIVENVGPLAPTAMVGHQESRLITDCMLQDWYASAEWQSNALLYMIREKQPGIIFSHFHGIDLQCHMFYKYMCAKPGAKCVPQEAIQWAEDVYVQADYYIGKFVHLLDEGWTICIFSDHGLVSSKYRTPFLGDTSGVNLRVMQELGFTEVQHDALGNELMVIDWSRTRAVATGECHIRINVKGRDPHGIVDPADQYDVETAVIDGLYNYREPKTGKRVVSIALRNKDAVLVGLGGPNSGDIVYFNEEGFNFDHGDCLSTTCGAVETSVSPIFIAAGRGIKHGVRTARIIRQVDFAATVAVLAGVRMPAQCEGAPVYQIFA